MLVDQEIEKEGLEELNKFDAYLGKDSDDEQGEDEDSEDGDIDEDGKVDKE